MLVRWLFFSAGLDLQKFLESIHREWSKLLQNNFYLQKLKKRYPEITHALCESCFSFDKTRYNNEEVEERLLKFCIKRYSILKRLDGIADWQI